MHAACGEQRGQLTGISQGDACPCSAAVTIAKQLAIYNHTSFGGRVLGKGTSLFCHGPQWVGLAECGLELTSGGSGAEGAEMRRMRGYLQEGCRRGAEWEAA